MSAGWRLKQSRWLLEQSRSHKNTFGSREYEYLVVATLDALYGTLGLLQHEYRDCLTKENVRFQDWYGNRAKQKQRDETTLLGFFFKVNVGVRSRLAHQDVPPIASSGERHFDEDTGVIVHERADWYFQDMLFLAQQDDAPDWVVQMARPVDELLEGLVTEVERIVRDANLLFNASLAQRIVGDVIAADEMRRRLDEGMPG